MSKIEQFINKGLEGSSVVYKDIQLPKFLIALWYSKGWKFMLKYPLDNTKTIENFLFWYLMCRKIEIKNNVLERKLFAEFLELFHLNLLKHKGSYPELSILQEIIKKRRADLPQFDENNEKFLIWWEHFGSLEYDIPLDTLAKNELRMVTKDQRAINNNAKFKDEILKNEAQSNIIYSNNISSIKDQRIYEKLCIFGFFNSKNGISEDAKIFNRYLKGVYKNIELYEMDGGYNGKKIPLFHDYHKNKSDIILIIAPIFEVYRIIFNSSNFIFSDKNILLTQWELENIDGDITFIFDIFDKLYTISDFICSGLLKYNSRFEVLPLPFNAFSSRADKKKLDKNLNYYFIYDEDSFIGRKNPAEVVSAFQEAFVNNENVALFIKASKITESIPDGKFIIEASQKDSRIKLFTGYMEDNAYKDFISSCDVLISLHRAEGFGRVVGEAIINGKLVISSNYGGVLDYLNSENSILVDGKLIEIKKDQYFCWKINSWFQPDVKEAALKIKKSYENYEKYKEMLLDFKKDFEKKYLVENIKLERF